MWPCMEHPTDSPSVAHHDDRETVHGTFPRVPPSWGCGFDQFSARVPSNPICSTPPRRGCRRCRDRALDYASSVPSTANPGAPPHRTAGPLAGLRTLRFATWHRNRGRGSRFLERPWEVGRAARLSGREHASTRTRCPGIAGSGIQFGKLTDPAPRNSSPGLRRLDEKRAPYRRVRHYLSQPLRSLSAPTTRPRQRQTHQWPTPQATQLSRQPLRTVLARCLTCGSWIPIG